MFSLSYQGAKKGKRGRAGGGKKKGKKKKTVEMVQKICCTRVV